MRVLLGWGVYGSPFLIGTGVVGLPRLPVVLSTVVFGIIAAGAASSFAGRVGPRHALRLTLLMWVLGLLLLASYSALSLSGAVRYVYGAWLAVAFVGVAVSDLRFVRASKQTQPSAVCSAALLVGIVLGVSSGWAISSLVPGGAPWTFLLFAVVTLGTWRLMGHVPDPLRTDDPLTRFAPWSAGDGIRGRTGWRRLAAAPVTTGYLVVSWGLFLPFATVRDGVLQLPSDLTERFAYSIPELTAAPLSALTTLVTAPLVNHDIIQLVYVTLLLVVVGVPFEAREGSRRFLLVFVGVGAAGALVAGILLHLAYPNVSTHPVLETAWERTWSGGSAGAFALMGAVAARAPSPWPLLGFFVFWEVNVGWWYLRSFTPAFHLSALFFGFTLVRWGLDPIGREDGRATQAPG